VSSITHAGMADVAICAPQMAEEGTAALSSGSGGGGAAAGKRAHSSTLGLYAHAFAALTASRQLLPPPLRAAVMMELNANMEVRVAYMGFGLGAHIVMQGRGLSDQLTPTQS
jgi:hypothetical protein